MQLKNVEEELETINEQILTTPFSVDAHIKKGSFLAKANRIEEALKSFEHALTLEPKNPVALLCQGNAFKARRHLDKALDSYYAAIAAAPTFGEVYTNLGVVQKELGQLEEAVRSHDQAIALRPDLAAAYLNKGVALKLLGRIDDAIAAYQIALQKDPNSHQAETNIASAYRAKGADAIAEVHLLKALRLKSNYVDALNNLGILYRDTNRLREAREILERAVSVSDTYYQGWINLGNVRKDLGDLDAAIQAYEKARSIDNTLPESFWGESLVRLSLGQYEKGFELYEFRWKTNEFKAIHNRANRVPVWLGESLINKHILVTWEQGLGDTFHFSRYLSRLEKLANKVTFLVQPAIEQIIRHSFQSVNVTGKISEDLNFDYQTSLMSLPCRLRLYGDTAISACPYLHSLSAYDRKWLFLRSITNLKIGLVWQGNPKSKLDRDRSIPLSNFRALLDHPNVTVFPLQKGYGEEQLEGLERSPALYEFGQTIDEQGGFLDTASIIKCMDVIFTSDTAIAHLAGALGARVFLFLQKFPEWRWGQDGSASHWYPNTRIFRQKHLGDWNKPINDAITLLEKTKESQIARRSEECR